MYESFLDKLKTRPDAIPKGDPRIETYKSDSVMTGDPDVVIRPRDWKDVGEVVKFCNGNDIPLTVCGSRTSMTGSSVAQEGVLLSMEGFDKLIDIENCERGTTATAEPGIIVGDFQKIVNDRGFFYPPAPTSVNEARLGSTIATNATGEDTFKYGPTRKYVRRLKIIAPDGSELILERKPSDQPKEIKATGGYYLKGSEIERFIGSEGTLGIIKEVTIDLLPKSPPWFNILTPFPSTKAALNFIREIALERFENLRALEFVDHEALKFMSTYEGFPENLKDSASLVIIKQEYSSEDRDALIERWFEKLSRVQSTEKAIIGLEPREQENIRLWRHRIPEAINELGRGLHGNGGGKVSGDWWVPVDKMPDMMEYFYEINKGIKMTLVAYGHLGNGHPHTSYIAKNSDEVELATELVKKASRRAVELGGGVAGEHGIGKVKRFLLEIQYGRETIEKMREIKQKYDPKWILGRGNILQYK